MVLTFDPPPPMQPANGLSVQGGTFSFSLTGHVIRLRQPAMGISWETSALGLLTLSDPVLDGPGDGILTLAFAGPSTLLSFDLALAIGGHAIPRRNGCAKRSELLRSGHAVRYDGRRHDVAAFRRQLQLQWVSFYASNTHVCKRVRISVCDGRFGLQYYRRRHS